MANLLGRPTFVVAVMAVMSLNVAAGRRADADQPPGRPPGFLYGDSGQYAQAAMSLWHDRDLDLLNQQFPDAADLRAALPRLQGAEGASYGLTADGRLTIKQSPVLAAAAVPFYALFGLNGFLLFNLAVLLLALVGTARLGGDTPTARLTVLAGFVVTPLWRFAYNFSPDLLLCGLLVGGLLAARSGRPLLAGLAAGLAVSTKPYAAAFLLPVPLLAVAVAVPGRRWRAALAVAAGGVGGLLPGLAFNWWQFGDALTTGYQRELAVAGDAVGVAGHASRFTLTPVAGLRDLLFHPTLGLVLTAPVWLAVAPVAAVWLLVRRADPPGGRGWVRAAAAAAMLNVGLFACYRGAVEGSRFGNRYLFPAVFAGLAVSAAAAGVLAERFRRPDRTGAV